MRSSPVGSVQQINNCAMISKCTWLQSITKLAAKNVLLTNLFFQASLGEEGEGEISIFLRFLYFLVQFILHSLFILA